MAKKKDKELKAVSIVLSAEDQEMLKRFREKAAAGVEKLEESERRELLSMLQGSLALAMAAVNELAALSSREAALLVVEIGSLFADKALHKMVKRTLFRLKQKNVPVEKLAADAEERPVYRPMERREPFGMISAIDAVGDRMAFLALPLQPQGWLLGGGVVGDELGLRDMVFNRMTRSELNSFLNDFDSGSFTALTRTSAQHVCSLLMESAEHMKARGEEPPEEFLDLKPGISEVFEPLKRPIVYEVITESEVSGHPEFAARSRSLLKVSPFDQWILPDEPILPYLVKMKEASQSRIVLAPTQKAALVEDIRRKATAELFPPERRRLMRRRLEESAYLLHLQGETEAAHTALAAALEMEKEHGLLHENEFLLALVERSLRYWEREEEQAEEETRADSGLIITSR